MTRDHRIDPDVHALVGAYSLDAMDGEERREFEAHLDGCEACRTVVGEFQATAARLGQAAEVVPSPAMRDRVLGAVDTTPQNPPALPLESRRRIQPLLAAAAAVLAVAVVVLGTLYTQAAARLDQLERMVAAAEVEAELQLVLSAPDVRVVAVAGAPEGSGAHFVWSDQRNLGVLVGDDMPQAPTGHTYAVWLISPEGSRYAGSFVPGEDGEVAVTVEGGIVLADQIGVTAEPPGTPVAPRGDVLMSATLV